jgi:hypothetical protein
MVKTTYQEKYITIHNTYFLITKICINKFSVTTISTITTEITSNCSDGRINLRKFSMPFNM